MGCNENTTKTQHGSWDSKKGLVAKNTSCPYRGPEFGSQDPTPSFSLTEYSTHVTYIHLYYTLYYTHTHTFMLTYTQR